jgi:hypothetical protein
LKLILARWRSLLVEMSGRKSILGSTLPWLGLLFHLPCDGLTPLDIVSAMFGLSQGSIVPSYALIDLAPESEAA